MATTKPSVLIVGAGTFGLSTAYHLARAGYKSITVLEKASTIPSPNSAGNDLNKIVRAEYEDPFYAELALSAIREWSTNPLFASHYHQTGYLLATSATAPDKSKRSLARSLESIRLHPAFAGQITPLESRGDIRAACPALDGPMTGWQGYLNRLAGYVSAAAALRAIYEEILRLGVTVYLGDGVAALNYDGYHCTGVTTAAGKHYGADVVILALGAAVATVLPRIGQQVAARAWSIAHVQLTAEETGQLRGIPVTYARDIGFFFEPDPQTGMLKISPSGAGYTNFAGADAPSVPAETSDFIPTRDKEAVRRLLRETLPWLANRPLLNTRLCWCADSAESDYVVDFVPGTRGLIIVTGDSGHGFKMLPIAGGWVRDLLETERQDIERWRWKEGKDARVDVSWRVGKSIDLKENCKN